MKQDVFVKHFASITKSDKAHIQGYWSWCRLKGLYKLSKQAKYELGWDVLRII